MSCGSNRNGVAQHYSSAARPGECRLRARPSEGGPRSVRPSARLAIARRPTAKALGGVGRSGLAPPRRRCCTKSTLPACDACATERRRGRERSRTVLSRSQSPSRRVVKGRAGEASAMTAWCLRRWGVRACSARPTRPTRISLSPEGPWASKFMVITAADPEIARNERRWLMAVQSGVYRCQRCGQEVRVTVEGLGVLVCCNLPMEQLGGARTDSPANTRGPGATPPEEV
jgi:desulfoferrodoxin-like iron-binding protein